MARRATYLLVMAVVAISMLLGYPAVALSQEVTSERLLHAAKEPHNWLMYYGNYQGWRYSPLQQINTTNVQRLAVKQLDPTLIEQFALQKIRRGSDRMSCKD